jgi:hypothetical protein
MPLNPVVDRTLSEAISQRKPCDFSAGGEADDPRGSAQWGPERRIEGALLRTLMLGNHPSYDLINQPLEIIGARIDGPVDFRAASLTRPIYFTRCAFTDPVDCTDARLKTVSFEGCRIGELRARYGQFDGSLLLRHSHFSGPLDLEAHR